MIIDIHVHTAGYSPCSRINLRDAVARAKSIGLSGICITDHESNGIASLAKEMEKREQFLVIVGMELLSLEGDLLVFGLEEVPDRQMHAQELVDLVNAKGGAVVCAHPYRDNGRGMGDGLLDIKGLNGIESFNGNTPWEQNSKAHALGTALHIPCLGGSDAHRTDRLGCYATKFPAGIGDSRDFINAIKAGEVLPVMFDQRKNVYQEVRL